MNAQQLHQQAVARTFLNPAKSATPMRLTRKALNDDSCWDEFDSDYEESLPSQLLAFLDDAD